MSLRAQIDDKELRELQATARKLGGEMKSDALRLVIGRALQQTVKAHFYKLASDAQHHETADRFGASRTGFYTKAADTTNDPQLESGGVSVSVRQAGIAQRLFGGTITPKTAKFLTIPARAEAYGKRAREFQNLTFILFPSGVGALVEREATVLRGRGERSKGDEIGGGVFFWLVKSVTQRADPTVLPTSEQVLEPVISNAKSYVERLWQRSQA